MNHTRTLWPLAAGAAAVLTSCANVDAVRPVAGTSTASPVLGTIVGYHSLRLGYGGTTEGSPLDLLTCNGSNAEKWGDAPTGYPPVSPSTTGQVELTAYNPNCGNLVTCGECLNVAGYGGAGTKVILWPCVDTNNEAWSYWPYWHEWSVSYGGRTYCLNDPAYSTKSGTQQIIWTCPDTANERYTNLQPG